MSQFFGISKFFIGNEKYNLTWDSKLKEYDGFMKSFANAQKRGVVIKFRTNIVLQKLNTLPCTLLWQIPWHHALAVGLYACSVVVSYSARTYTTRANRLPVTQKPDRLTP
jgi:hypothetical protein